MPLANNAGSNARACRMLSWKASVLLRPAVAGRESNSGKSSIPASSRIRFFTEFVEDSGSVSRRCGLWSACNFIVMRWEWTCYEEVETLPDVAAATFASDFREDLCVGQHQIHRERCGRIVGETQAGKISRPVKHGVAVLLKKGEPTLRTRSRAPKGRRRTWFVNRHGD
jgi:hypothetical protein